LYYKTLWSKVGGTIPDSILSSLPPSLGQQVRRTILIEPLSSSYLLRGLPLPLLDLLEAKMTHSFLPTGERLY